jgi:hypothetical protein
VPKLCVVPGKDPRSKEMQISFTSLFERISKISTVIWTPLEILCEMKN